MTLEPAAVALLLESLDSANTAYILGAGASAPDVPVMQELIRRVLGSFRENVKGFIPTEEPTPTHYLFAEQASDEDTRQELLASSIETFRVLIAHELKPKPLALQEPPAQYRVLAAVRPGATMINYNVDGLASQHCARARVLVPHGQVPDFVGRMPLAGAVHLTQEGIEIVPAGSFWLPEPEREQDLVARIDPAYRSLLNVGTIVVIGYSFGLSSDGIMDRVSFEALREYCRGKKVRILVVDPSPWRLAETLGETLQNLEIIPVPAYWNVLCRAILSVSSSEGVHSLEGLRGWAKDIAGLYPHLLDQ